MSTVLITGANRGIGLELARQLTARGDTVLATTRRPSAELDALGVRTLTLDVTDDDAVANLPAQLGDVSLDAAILNAGVLKSSSLDHLALDDIRAMLEVNTLGALKVAAALRPNLANPSKLAIITSRMGSIADNGSGGSYGYRASKAAVNAIGKSLALDLAEAGVSVALLHPGWVRTDMTGHTGMVDADESAAGLIARLDALSPETSGSFWHMNGDSLPW